MNAHIIPVRMEFSGVQDLRGFYRDIRRKVTSPPPAPKENIIHHKFRYDPRTMVAGQPLWQRQKTHFKEHMNAWYAHISKKGSEPLNYLKERCIEEGVTYEQIISRKKSYGLMDIRQRLQWEVKTKFDLSFPQVGHIFRRDHTSVIHNFYKVNDAMRAGGLK